MLTKALLQMLQSLKQKKFREIHSLFIVEGKKSVIELLGSKLRVKLIIALHSEIDSIQLLCPSELECLATDAKTLGRISSLVTPQPVLAVVHIPEYPAPADLKGCQLMLDNIRDPGNLGSIIRIADWYGLTHIFCSHTCVDAYNPKTVQAAMGSLFRVQVRYTDLEEQINNQPLPVYGAMLSGVDIHQQTFEPNHYLIIGSESTGISENLSKRLTQAINIPRIGEAESLNAAVAAGIILDNVHRK